MATFRVPSPSSNSSTSTTASSMGRRIPGNFRRSPSRISKTPSSSSSGRSRDRSTPPRRIPSPGGWDRYSPRKRIRSPGGTSQSPPPLTQRQWRKKYGAAPNFIPEQSEDDAESGSDAPTREIIDEDDLLPDYESSDNGSIGSNIVVASRRTRSGPRRLDDAGKARIRKLLDHENIGLFQSEWKAPKGTPMEFRPDPSTLESLIRRRKKGGGLPASENPGALPEMLCWHVLRSLLRVVHYLHTGKREIVDLPNPGWQPIVHNCINPSNILFDPEHTNARTYKTVQLRNFSHCVLLPRVFDPNNARDNAATADDRREAFADARDKFHETGFEAPELLDTTMTDAPSPGSDMWSIGAVLVAMMTARTVWDLVLEKDFIESSKRPRRRHDALPEKFQVVALSSRVRARQRIPTGKLAGLLPDRYGMHLRIIVETLLDIDPFTRGTAVEVWKDVENLGRARQQQKRDQGRTQLIEAVVV